jgi:hypothetical protein
MLFHAVNLAPGLPHSTFAHWNLPGFPGSKVSEPSVSRVSMKFVVLLILLFAVSSNPAVWAQDVFGDAPIRFVLLF